MTCRLRAAPPHREPSRAPLRRQLLMLDNGFLTPYAKTIGATRTAYSARRVLSRATRRSTERTTRYLTCDRAKRRASCVKPATAGAARDATSVTASGETGETSSRTYPTDSTDIGTIAASLDPTAARRMCGAATEAVSAAFAAVVSLGRSSREARRRRGAPRPDALEARERDPRGEFVLWGRRDGLSASSHRGGRGGDGAARGGRERPWPRLMAPSAI